MMHGAFEVEAGTMEGFLDLLRVREEECAPAENEPLPRRAVFVAPLTRMGNDGTGIPGVTRRVRACFAYGVDLVSLNRLTSDGYEFPEPFDDHEKKAARQDEVLSKTHEQLEEGIRRLGLSVPVVAGWLRLPNNAAGASGTQGPAPTSTSSSRGKLGRP